MKVIGVEFRLGMEQMRQLEVFVKPVNITFPWAEPYPYGPTFSVTVHTSEGDVGVDGNFRNLLLARITAAGPYVSKGISADQAVAAYEKLRQQITRIEGNS